MSIKNFEIIDKLGTGAFSTVWKVRCISTRQEYAMKKVNMSLLTDKEKQNALNEVRILASVQSPHVIGYKEAFFDGDSMTLYLIMELASAGDLRKLLEENIRSNCSLREEEIWQFLIQILKGLKALHEKKILHRDLKAANIFMTSERHIKIGDLNMAKIIHSSLAQTQAGTPYYASPEVWRGQPYNTKSDIWSFGCVIYEMAALKPPFRAKNAHELYTKVVQGAFDRIPLKYSSELYNIISICLRTNPVQRPSCDQLLNHPSLLKHTQDVHIPQNLEFCYSNLIGTCQTLQSIHSVGGSQLLKPNYEVFKRANIHRCTRLLTEDPPLLTQQDNAEKDGKVRIDFPFTRVQSADEIQISHENNFVLQPHANNKENLVYFHKGSSYKRQRSAEREEEFLQRMQNEYLKQLRRLSPDRVIEQAAIRRSEISDISAKNHPKKLILPPIKIAEARETKATTHRNHFDTLLLQAEISRRGSQDCKSHLQSKKTDKTVYIPFESHKYSNDQTNLTRYPEKKAEEALISAKKEFQHWNSPLRLHEKKGVIKEVFSREKIMKSQIRRHPRVLRKP